MKSEIEVFDSTECVLCPMQLNCSAGRLIANFEEDTRNAASNILEHYTTDVVNDVADGVSVDLTHIQEVLSKASERANKVRQGLEELILSVINLPPAWTSRSISPDPREVETERVRDELSILEEQHPNRLLPEEVEPLEHFEAAANDVRRFTAQGECRASNPPI